MTSHRRLNLVITAAVLCLVILWLSTSVGQSRRSYEVEAQVYTTPEYRTDASRAIDAYERVMDRYMDATQQSFTEVLYYTQTFAAKLESIDAKLEKLDKRLARIERHLGIVPPLVSPVPDPNAPRPPAPVPPAPSAPLPLGGR
jgi:hypothetical protein